MVHIGAAIFLLGSSAGLMILALQQQVGALFVFFLLLSLILFAPLPVMIYRTYALSNAYYSLERDGLRIRWGLRAEDIPLPEIEWVRPASDMGFRLPLPWLKVPGAILGTRHSAELGLIEYLASDQDSLILIATPQKVYAISPEDARGFVRAFQYTIELGSLTPLKAYSVLPAAFAQRVWNERPARISLIIGFLLTLALLIYVSLLIPTRGAISLGFTAQLQPAEPGPPERLLLLPVLGLMAYLADLLAGMYFYRRPEDRPTAYMLWISSAFTPILLFLATFFIL